MPPTVARFRPTAGGGAEPWDLVALGDSNVSGWGVRADEPYTPEAAYPGAYAQLLADQQGVEIVLHSYYPDQLGNEFRTIAEWTDVLRTDQSMRADLASADVVTVLIGYHNLVPAVVLGGCGPTWPDPLRKCLAAATAPMAADFDQLYGEVVKLVSDGVPVLVNDYGIPGPVYDRWSSDPAWPEIRRAVYEDWRDALEDAATAHGFRTIHTYRGLNGTDGRPRYDWSSITTDGWHFNSDGHRLVARIVMAEDGLGD